jgi:hypothetical protein
MIPMPANGGRWKASRSCSGSWARAREARIHPRPLTPVITSGAMPVTRPEPTAPAPSTPGFGSGVQGRASPIRHLRAACGHPAGSLVLRVQRLSLRCGAVEHRCPVSTTFRWAGEDERSA